MGKQKKHARLTEIQYHGHHILRSKEFSIACSEKQHLCNTTGRHSINVATTALFFCDLLQKVHIQCNRRDVIVSALCHDLGMIHRHDIFANRKACLKRHADLSVAIARNVIPNITHNALDAIECHMWPITPHRPKTKEAIILSLADKVSAVKDIPQGLLFSFTHDNTISLLSIS